MASEPQHALQQRLEALLAVAGKTMPLRRIEALLQRMPGQDAAVTELLCARADAALMHCEQSATPAVAPAPLPRCSQRLTPLLQMLATSPRAMQQATAVTSELEAVNAGVQPLLEDARQVWRAVRARSQLRQSLAQSQEHAGPLNSGRLVLRMLDVMQATSPEYLECLLTYVDVLLGLEALTGSGERAPEPVAPRRGARGRKRRENA